MITPWKCKKPSSSLLISMPKPILIPDRFELNESDPNIEFYIDPENDSKFYYKRQVERMVKEEKTTLYVDFEHVNQFKTGDDERDFGEDILVNYYRFEPFIRKAISMAV